MKRRDLLKLLVAAPILPYVPNLPQLTFTQKLVRLTKQVVERQNNENVNWHANFPVN